MSCERRHIEVGKGEKAPINGKRKDGHKRSTIASWRSREEDQQIGDLLFIISFNTIMLHISIGF